MTNVKFWDWDNIMALDIGEVSSSRSLCSSGVAAVTAWTWADFVFRTNTKNKDRSIMDPKAVFSRTKEHCLMYDGD